MAHVAICMVWAWTCPECAHVTKDWSEHGAVYHSFEHLDLHGLRHVIDPVPQRMTWAFNVVSDPTLDLDLR